MVKEQQLSVVPFKSGRSLIILCANMNSLLTSYAESKDTGGSFEFGEWLEKPGNEPPPYVLECDHEFYYVPEKRD
jgi:hypothetical protein